MVNLNNVFLTALGIASILALSPVADACTRPDLLGRVKSVTVTEAFVDPVSGKIGEMRLVSRMDVTRDGGTAETTVYSKQSPAVPATKFTTSFESGRVVRGVEVAPTGKIVSTTNCRYDVEGRLVEAKTQSDNVERTKVETYEYRSGSIRRRAKTFTGVSVIEQTLDADGRPVKEEVIDEGRSVVDHHSEYTYNGNREEVCRVYMNDGRRYCSTTIRDAHGNEVEVRSEGNSRKMVLEYDSVGNWILKRTSIVGQGTSIETIVQRRIEYW